MVFYLLNDWGGKKETPPLKNQGWDTKSYSTVPPWLQHKLPLIDAVTGAPGMAFPHTRLRSGIAIGRGTEPSHQTGSSLGILPSAHVFIAAFDK